MDETLVKIYAGMALAAYVLYLAYQISAKLMAYVNLAMVVAFLLWAFPDLRLAVVVNAPLFALPILVLLAIFVVYAAAIFTWSGLKKLWRSSRKEAR